MDVNIVWEHGKVDEWSMVSEMSGECHVRTIDVIQRCAMICVTDMISNM